MTRKADQTMSLGQYLRDRGFVPLPRLWIKASAMTEIHTITGRFKKEVNEARTQVTEIKTTQDEIEKLWQEHERSHTS